jgi:hypothetical protein
MKTLTLVAALIITPLSIADDLHYAPPGEISIIVYDTRGNPLPGAVVTLESGDVHKRNTAVATAAEWWRSVPTSRGGELLCHGKLVGIPDANDRPDSGRGR